MEQEELYKLVGMVAKVFMIIRLISEDGAIGLYLANFGERGI